MGTVKRFGDLVEGDVIEGTDGDVVVSRAYDEHIPERMYRLEFDDNNFIEASGNHLWYIETDRDRALHSQRLRYGYKIFKNLSSDIIEDFTSIAEFSEVAEVSLNDMINFLDAKNNQKMFNALIRIAESIGPIAEETEMVEDLETGDIIQKSDVVKLYDARLFCQQVLSLGNKKLRKKYPVIVGKVVTTDKLSMLVDTVNIPEVRSRD